MDGRRFDEWARLVAGGLPRRRLLRAIGAALFGSGLLRVAGITTAQTDVTPEPGTPVSDTEMTEEVSQAEYQTCDAACRKPRRKDQVRPYLVSCLSNKPCADTGCGCHLYRKGKEKEAKWEHYADQGVEKGLDDDAYTYECRCVRATSAQTSTAACEPIASEAALQRQLVGLVDAAPRPDDTRRDGFVRLDGAVTLSLDEVPGLRDEARAALTGLGAVGAYSASIGVVSGVARRLGIKPRGLGAVPSAALARFAQVDPIVDTNAVDTRVSFTAHVLECVAPIDPALLATLVPAGATVDAKVTPVGDESQGFQWDETDGEGRTWQHFATVVQTGNVVFTLDSAFTGNAKPGRSLNDRIAPMILGRLPGASDDPARFAENRLASNRLVFAEGTVTLSLACIGYGGTYVPAAVDTANELAFNQAAFATVDSGIVARSRWSATSEFFVSINRFATEDTALADIAGRRGSFDVIAQAGHPVERRPGAEGTGADWTFHAAIFPQDQGFAGVLSSLSRAGDLERESAVFVSNIDTPAEESTFATFERVLGTDYTRFFDYSARQFACLTTGDDVALCRLFGSTDVTPIVAQEEEVGQETVLGDGKIVPWLSMGSLVQPDDYAPDARFHLATRCVRAGALPGLTRSEAQASRDLGAREGMDLKLELMDGPPGLVTGFARFEDQPAAFKAFDWYRTVEYPGIVRRDAAAPFAGNAYDLSFIPNLKLGTLDEADWTRLTFPYGNLGVAVFARGDEPEQAQTYGKLILDRLEQGEPRGGGLDTAMIQLAGSNVDPYLTLSPLALNGAWLPQAGEDAAAVRVRAEENPGHLDWIRSQQQLRSKVPAVDHALVDEKRRFETLAEAQAWFDDIEARLARTFVGINLIPITEAAPLAKPDGLADAVKAFLIDFRPSPTVLTAGLLIYALYGSVVATLNLRGVSESAEDQEVIDFFAWLFREGGLPLALFGVEIMARELQLLDDLYPEDDDDEGGDFNPRFTVGPTNVYPVETARRTP